MISAKAIGSLARFRTTYLVLIISMYGLLFGLDTAAVAVTLPMLKTQFGLGSTQMEFLSAVSSLGAILGLLLVIFAGSRVTRRTTLLINTTAYVAGFIMVAMANSFTTCVIGRVIVGFAHGISTMIAPVYIGELSPKEFRGLFISFSSVGINLGMPVGFTLATAMSTVPNYSRWMFTIIAILSFIVAVLMYTLVPNSPRDLIFHGHDKEARVVIQRLSFSKVLSDEEVTMVMSSLSKAIRNEQLPKFSDLFTAGNRRALTVACTLQIAKQLSGFTALQFFSVYLFKIIGLTKGHISQLPTIMLGLVQFISAVASLGIIDFMGRRKLLLMSTLSMTAGLIVLGGSFVVITGFDQINKTQCSEYSRCGSCLLDTACGWAAKANVCMSQKLSTLDFSALADSCQLHTARDHIGSWMAVASLIIALGAMSLGLGSIPWVIQAEMFSQSLRSKAGGVASICNWLSSFVSTVLFLRLAFVVTLPGIFWLYAGLLLATVASVYWAIPETAGRALEDIAEGMGSEAQHGSKMAAIVTKWHNQHQDENECKDAL